MATNSTPITGLPENVGRMQKEDLMLISKKVDGDFESKKLSYSSLTSNISVDILPLIPKVTFPIYDSNLPLDNRRDDMSYSTNSVTKFYEEVQDKMTDLGNNKLDKTTTNSQTVQSQVTFKG